MTTHESVGWMCPQPALPPTPLQLRCLAEFAYHADMHDAADCLGMPYHSLKNNLARLYWRLGVTRFAEAVRAVGWLVLPSEAA